MRKYTLKKIDDVARLGPHVAVLGGINTGPQDDHVAAYLALDTDAPGAWTRVVKAWNEPGDTHALGATATVLGSTLPEDYPRTVVLEPGENLYCVEWDDQPGTAIFCRGKKLARA